MKSLRYYLPPLLAALLCIPLGGCKMGNASDSWPKVLHYAFSPQSEQLQGGALRMDLMRNYLQSQLHMPVDVVLVEGYAPTIEAMRADKVDVATYGGLGYILASQKAGAEAIVARGFPGDKLGGYRSLIAVPKNSPYHSLADLKAHAKDIVFAFADPASTSGNLYPRVELQNLGIDPEKDFKQVLYANGHLAALMTVKAGKVDAAAFMQGILIRMIQEHRIQPSDVRILWTSELIPNSCVAVRKALPEKLKQEIQTAFLTMPQKDPALWANLNSLYHTLDTGTQYVPVDDATYNGLRKYASQVKDFKFAEN